MQVINDAELLKLIKENIDKSYLFDNDILKFAENFCSKKEFSAEKRTISAKLSKILLKKSFVFLLPLGSEQNDEYKKIDNLLDEFLSFENLIYESADFYRDHLVHQFRVFLLGEYFLFVKDFIKKIDLKNKYEKYFECAWCIASLIHDLAYAVPYIEKLNSKMQNILELIGGFEISPFKLGLSDSTKLLTPYRLEWMASDSSHLFNLINDKPLNNEDRKYKEDILQSMITDGIGKLNHGIFSALFLVNFSNNYAKKCFEKVNLDKNEQLIRICFMYDIGRSIAFHDLSSIPLSFKKSPMPFLLYLCDEFQEWERPYREKNSQSQISPEAKVSTDLFFIDSYFKFEIEIDYSNAQNEDFLNFKQRLENIKNKLLDGENVLKVTFVDNNGISYQQELYIE